MDQQLRLAEHLSTCIIGNTRVDTGIVWSHVSQHQGIRSSILPLAQPGSIHQLGAVLDKQETDPISLSWDMPAPGLTHSSWNSTSKYLLCAQPQAQARSGMGSYHIGLQGGAMEWGLWIA